MANELVHTMISCGVPRGPVTTYDVKQVTCESQFV